MKVIDEFEFIGELQSKEKIQIAFRNNYGYHGNPLPDNITEVVIDEHCLCRWNERVGPVLSIKQLDTLFSQRLSIPYRITTLSREIAVIDDDILFIYRIIENKLIVITIYGRISLNPSLQDLKRLKSFNYRMYDRLKLEISEQLLSSQIAPYLPNKMYFINGTNHLYRIEQFSSIEGEIVFLKIFSNGIQNGTFLDLENPKQAPIKRKVLYIIKQLGYTDFVVEHVAHHSPDKISDSLDSNIEILNRKAWAEEQRKLAEQEEQAKLDLLERVFI